MKARICIVGLLALVVGCTRSNNPARQVDRVFGTTGLGDGEFSYPRAIALSPIDACVFVIDKTARVQRFSARGEFEKSWRMPEWEQGKPTGCTVDSANRLWVADTHYARVMVYDRDGHEQFRFGSRGDGPGQFIFPTSIAIDVDGNIYVGEYGASDHGAADRISKFSPQRKFITSFGGRDAGEAALDRPTGLKFDAQNNLWLADACHHRVCRFDRQGKLLASFGKPGTGPGELNYPYDLALEAGDTLLVADRGNNRIVRFARDGKYLGAWGSPGRAVGELAQPWAVAVTPNAGRSGPIYCLDSWNNRVQVIHW